MIDVMHFERRDDAEREALGKGAFALTQALRSAGAVSSRFYWVGPDTIVVQTDVGEALSESPPSGDAARALFAMGDLARTVRREQWITPAVGEQSYHAAGR